MLLPTSRILPVISNHFLSQFQNHTLDKVLPEKKSRLPRIYSRFCAFQGLFPITLYIDGENEGPREKFASLSLLSWHPIDILSLPLPLPNRESYKDDTTEVVEEHSALFLGEARPERREYVFAFVPRPRPRYCLGKLLNTPRRGTFKFQ